MTHRLSGPFCAVRRSNHVFLYYNGDLVYKRWVDADGEKTEPSMLFNEQWPNEKIARSSRQKEKLL